MKIDQKQLARELKQEKSKPPISLLGESPKKTTKDNSLTVKLQSQPGQDGSPTYELTVPILDGTETPYQLILFMENVKKIFVGQNLTTGPHQYAMVRRLLKDQPLAVFNTKATELNTETTAHAELCLRACC